jgi:uncharacterized protein (DUF433 family)
MKFTRITVDPAQMGGAPCIRRLRVPVTTIVGMIADGMTRIDILAAYPDLEPEDITEALRYAAQAVCERELSKAWAMNAEKMSMNMLPRTRRIAPLVFPNRFMHYI